MGYTGSYSLGTRCAAEFIGLMLVIFLGESSIANAELPRTKGHGMSYGWVSAGFGAAFGLALAFFNRISGHFNWAVLVTLWILGDLDAGDVFALGAAEFGGAFVGAVLVWLHFLPHFRTLPLPPGGRPETNLLTPGGRPAANTAALASEHPRVKPKSEGTGPRAALLSSFGDIGYYTRSALPPERRATLEAIAIGRDSMPDLNGTLRRRSVQVADMHRRLEAGDVDLTDMREDLRGISLARNSICLGELEEGITHPQGGRSVEHGRHYRGDPADGPAAENGHANARDGRGGTKAGASEAEKENEEENEQTRLSEAAIKLDMAVKLSVFSTRPAVPAPLLNLLVEFLGTTLLILGALLLGLQGDNMTPDLHVLWLPFEAAFTGWLVFLLVVGLGGPTGIAMNPTRDLAPRLAHWLLPIPGKGSSEWGYSLVPLVGGLLGGAAAAGLFAAIRTMFIPAAQGGG